MATAARQLERETDAILDNAEDDGHGAGARCVTDTARFGARHGVTSHPSPRHPYVLTCPSAIAMDISVAATLIDC